MNSPTSFQQKRASKNQSKVPKSRSTYQMATVFNNNPNVEKPFVVRGDREMKNADSSADDQLKYLLYKLSVWQGKIHEAKIFDNRIKGRDNIILIFFKGTIVSHALPEHLKHLIKQYQLATS